jgi:hypothetical protein
LRSCALHYALDEDHVDAIIGAVRDAGSRRASGRMPLVDSSPADAGRPVWSRRAEEPECVS